MKFKTYAKCILSGEHAVLRGGNALAFPIKDSSLEITIANQDDFVTKFTGVRSDEVKIPFWMAMDRGLEILNKTRQDLRGFITINNDIPVGSGLGASASFCVAISKLFIHYGWLDDNEAFSFSKSLEDVFHGESSGLDVAVSLHNKGILFHREKGIKAIDTKWQPNLYLTYSGSRGLTADCVKKVKELWQKDPSFAQNIDEKMASSVDKIQTAFMKTNDLYDLKDGLDIGLSCFQDWNLVNANLREHMQGLRDQGALAMKPTGSGEGGYVLSLWSEGKKPSLEGAISLF